jgi:hypothetical protein
VILLRIETNHDPDFIDELLVAVPDDTDMAKFLEVVKEETDFLEPVILSSMTLPPDFQLDIERFFIG